MWDRFPASAKPRPVVPIGSGLVLAPTAGFLRDPNAKLAFVDGDFALRTVLPETPKRTGGYRLLTAASAFRLLKSGGGKGPSRGAVLAVTGVRLGSATFQTDRGESKLPAWLFSFADVKGPAAVLAIAPPNVFNPPTPRTFSNSFADFEDDSATVSGGGKDLIISFIGARAGSRPCDAAYSITTVEDAHAVAFTITSRPVPGCSDVGYTRTAQVQLKSPFGGRVLVDGSNGGVIPVIGHSR